MSTPNARRRGAAEVAPIAPTDTELVALTRIEPVRTGGPTQAQVPPTEVNDWLARGWQRATAVGEADAA